MAGIFTRIVGGLVVAGALGAGAFLYITRPQPLPADFFKDAGTPDVKNGALVFSMGGCVSCHGAKGAEDAAAPVLSGGLALNTPFGIFHVPNISPDEKAGIGNWTLADFGNAMKRGIAPDGSHLYPSFPYASYSRMSAKDVSDLFAYIKTLPKSSNASQPHELSFPFNIRQAIGAWKFLYLDDRPRVTLAGGSELARHGQYIVEGPGHCGECHTPRDALGGLKTGNWLAGGPNPEGKGKIPNITPGGEIKSWSAADIATYLETGMTPDFDSVGGSMVEVQKNMAKLPDADRQAIAAYLKAIPAR